MRSKSSDTINLSSACSIPSLHCVLGECPVWDEVKERIVFVDILKGTIHHYTPGTDTFTAWRVGRMIGSVAMRSDGGLIATLDNGFALIDPELQTTSLVGNPEAHLPDNRFNDGKCDPQGRFWAGTMDYVKSTNGAGSLYRLNGDLSINRVLGDVSCSNGLAWSRDGATLYFIDTPSRQIAAFDFDGTDGSLCNKRAVVTIPADQGWPDGMTIDNEGMLWVAHWNGWRVTRWDPDLGRLLLTVFLPTAQITSCTFGGEDLGDLYITSATTGLNSDQIQAQPTAGCLFGLKNCGVRGTLASRFKYRAG